MTTHPIAKEFSLLKLAIRLNIESVTIKCLYSTL